MPCVDTYQSNQWTAASFWAQARAFAERDGTTEEEVIGVILLQAIPAGNA